MMTRRDIAGSALTSLRTNKVRSLLTMLGIIIGVGSVVLMVSAGKTLQGYVLDQIESLGNNLVDIYPSGLEKFGRPTDTITHDDFLAIRELTTVESVAPVVFVTEKVTYADEEESPQIFGTTAELLSNFNLVIDRGRPLEERDDQSASSVVVLGSEVAEKLFDTADPLGRKVKMGSRSLEVVGVLQAAGSLLLSDFDRMAFVPYSTARTMTGKKYVDYVSVRATMDDGLAIADVTSLLRDRHQISNPEGDTEKDDFTARSAEQATEIVGVVTLGLTVFLALIAGISLLVGGIGIMNIMLVSVSERTKEIGLRKAVGARRKDILLQFLLEAITLTTLGGLIGFLGGAGLAYLVAKVASVYLGELRFILSFPAVIAALTMAVGTGVVFGLYPARLAASISPMEAMRYE